MRAFTLASVGVSGVLALGALFVAKALLPGTSAARETTMAARPVVVARGDLKYGQKITAANLTLVNMPEGSIPAAAYLRVEDAVGKDGAVLLTSLSANEVLLPAKLSTGGRASLAATIGEGYRAYTVRVSEVTGGGGHVLAGDHVDVLLTREETGADEKDKKRTDTLLQDIRVLGMDLETDTSKVDKALPKTATLEVSPADAARLAVAGEVGSLSLALRPVGSMTVAPVATIRVEDLHGLGGPAPAAKPAPRLRPVAGPKPIPVRAPAPMLIIQGDQRTTVTPPRMASAGAGA